MSSITVCIASIGRPSLLETLNSLRLCVSEDFHVDVVIADDSEKGAVGALIATTDWPFAINVVNAGGRNISVARNLCLEAASGKYLAFIDDDETAHPEWLDNFFTQAEDTNADAVFGPVDAIFPVGTSEWMKIAGPFIKRPGPHGTKVVTGSTCNAFVRSEIVKMWGLKFKAELGQSGGEDTDFFFKMHTKGALLIASETALLYELVPPDRLSIRSLSRRYTRGGQTFATVMQQSSSLLSKTKFYIGAFFKLVISTAVVVLFILLRKDIAMTYAFKAWLNLGKLRRLLGMKTIKLY